MSDTQVVVNEAIIVYPSLDKPRPYNGIPGSNERYTSQLIISPNESQKVQAAHDAAVMATFRVPNPKMGKDAVKTCEWAPLTGFMQVSTTNYPESPPRVCFPNMSLMPHDVMNQQIFNGCKVKVAITFHGYLTGEKGVRCVLEVLQLLDNVNTVKMEIGIDPEKLGFQPLGENAPPATASTPGDPRTFGANQAPAQDYSNFAPQQQPAEYMPQQQPVPQQQPAEYMPQQQPVQQQPQPSHMPPGSQAPGPQPTMPAGVDPNNPWGN